MPSRASKPTVHERGNKRLDAVLEFVAFAARPMPLVTLLDEAPRRIALVFDADVCSLYLLEGDGHTLVMRGNVGFTQSALGQVRLRVGEGITGEAVEYLRPISATSAEQHAAYKHFRELGEERFPAFLAVPMRGKSGALGALVVQRRSPPFVAADVELLSALGALVAAGVRHAELVDAQREKKWGRSSPTGRRKVTLTGRPIVPGRALGVVAALRRPSPRPTDTLVDRPTDPDGVRRLTQAFDTAGRALGALRRRAKELSLGDDAAFLRTYAEILGDQRFRERSLELVALGAGIPRALAQVAREATRTAVAITRDAYSEERAHDIADLCDALTVLAGGDRRGDPSLWLPSKAILIGDGLTVFDLLVSARAQPAGVALSERASGPRTRALLALLGRPAVVEVAGLFRWAEDGEVMLLDADHGLVVLNPSKGEVATVREHKRGQAKPGP